MLYIQMIVGSAGLLHTNNNNNNNTISLGFIRVIGMHNNPLHQYVLGDASTAAAAAVVASQDGFVWAKQPPTYPLPNSTAPTTYIGSQSHIVSRSSCQCNAGRRRSLKYGFPVVIAIYTCALTAAENYSRQTNQWANIDDEDRTTNAFLSHHHRVYRLARFSWLLVPGTTTHTHIQLWAR